ncbi:NAD-dependent epimerase/dehydratase family protein [Legionella sp. PATHC035]|uniref:NAD-dependent epimerase/dehydratase family protein n=1 Tax=Legionella sp. PATHC035 TaxID=2992040 RepID=UPI002244D4C8|nr:NAD-dependent epimerase/dehydratase family protein [Legionella sp. PATHC035]MCW8409588.1 NAD-dependent epimerase/dehydratase family protein [Legionella sp. PATHC035]
MKVFVTGGSGFVGGHCIKRLLADEHSVVAPARHEVACKRLRALGASSTVLEYADPAALKQAMAGCDAAVHIAAHLKMWGAWEDFEVSNVTLTDQVLKAATACSIKRFVHVSAASVVMQEAMPITHADESWPLTELRHLPYSSTKAIAESHVLAAHSDGFSTVALRPPLIWGPGDMVDGDFGDRVRKRQFAWISRGEYPYATCHVQNLCQAIALALRSEVTGAYFLTDDEDITLREFITQRLHASGLETPRMSVPAPVAWLMGKGMEKLWATGWLPGEPPLTRELVRLIGYPFTLDISRAKTVLGYKPEITIREGMSRVRGSGLEL